MADAAKVSIPRLTQTNWGSWKQRMEWLLEREDLWETISVAKPEPETEEWKAKDRKARANIGLFLDESQFKIVKNCDSAKAMWLALQEHHEKVSMSTIVHYLNLLCSASLSEGGCMEAHLEHMEDLFDKLTAAGQNLEESLRITMVFRSVPSSYLNLVHGMQSQLNADWTVLTVKNRLLEEYRQRQNRGESLGQDLKAMKLSAAGGKTDRVCYFCQQPRHIRRNCEKWLAQKKNDSEKKPKSEDRNPKAKQADGGASSSAVCFAAGSVIRDCWVIDSGATCHMTCDKSFFTELRETAGATVTLADGKKTKATGIGKGIVYGENGRGERVEVTMKDVLYVPELDGGLISVGALVANGFSVEFGVSGCAIRNGHDEIVVIGEKSGGLYQLRIQERSLKVAGDHHERCQHTWHRRIGHRDPDVLRRMKSEELVSGFEMKDCGVHITCESCLKGKQARASFPV